MTKKEPKFLQEFKYLWDEDIKSARELIADGYWHLKNNRSDFKLKEEDFDHVNKIAKNMLEPLKALVEVAGISGMDEKGVRPYAKYIVSVIDIHLKRCNEYRKKTWSKPRSFRSKADQKSEGAFQQTKVIPESRKIREVLQKLNIESDQSRVEIEFEANQVASIPMREVLCERSQKIKKKVDSLNIDWDEIIDNGIFINMKKSDIPEYKPDRHFWDQDEDVLKFWVSEYNKCRHGYNIDGYEMSGSMYFQINFFKTPIKDLGNKITNAFLRDNEWYIDEILKYAKKKAEEYKEAGVLIGGTRRFSKTTSEVSHTHRGILIYPTETGTVISSNKEDLDSLVDKLKKTLDYIVPAFKLNILSGKSFDTKNPVIFGLKSSNGRESYEQFTLRIINTEGGSAAGNKKTAGGNPKIFVSDEVFKSSFINMYKAAIPSFESSYGWACLPVFTGCLTAGNKVFNKEGNLINIEDLRYEDGIVGYDVLNFKDSYEDILNINPPQRKECYEVITNKGTKIECSFDHPFYIKHRNKTEVVKGTRKTKRKCEFVEAKDLKTDMYLTLPDILPLKGDRVMKDPYFVGAIIGDGNYSGRRGLRFFNEDQEIWDYIDSINKDYIITKSYTTKKGKLYKESRFRGGMKYIKELGIYGQSGENKDLPKDIHLYRQEDIVEFIAGLFDTDGTVYCNKISKISISQSSEKLIDSLKILLIRLGIHSNKYKEFPKYNEKKRINSTKPYYILNIQDRESCLRFAELIPLKVRRKKDKLKEVVNFYKDKKSNIDKYRPNMRFERIVSVKKVGAKPVYNLTTSKTHTYLANGVITHNTGDVSDISPDAEKALNNPTNYGFLEGVWDILEYKIPKEAITWQRRTFGWFMPAQMSIYTGMKKIKTNLADFLDIDSEELRKIVFYQTDWINNSNYIREKRKTLKGEALLAEKIYRPIDPDECFLSMKSNPYPANDIKVYQTRLKLEGDEVYGTAKKIDLHRDSEGKVYHTLSNKEVSTYPHSGGFTDSPFLLFGEFPEEPPRDSYRFIAGLDDYRKEDTAGDSIASFIIFDRLTRKIVLTLANRPNPHSRLHQQIHMALDAFNAKCFPEAVDMAIKTYFDRKGLSDHYLARGFDALADFAAFSNAKTKYGWNPNKTTTPLVRSQVIDYVNSITDLEDENGVVLKTVRGFEKIEDIQILEELIKYKENGNFDRLVALGSVLMYDFYLTAKRIMPLIIRKKEEDQDNKPRKHTRRNKLLPKGRGFRW